MGLDDLVFEDHVDCTALGFFYVSSGFSFLFSALALFALKFGPKIYVSVEPTISYLSKIPGFL